MSRVGRFTRIAVLACAGAILAACNIPSLETLSRRQAQADAPGAMPATVTVRSGDTVYGIARRYRQSPQAVIDANGLRSPFTLWPGQVLRLPGGPGHTVRDGDSLYAIARRYDVPAGDLARINGLRPPYTIYVGQRLAIPRPSRVAAPPVVATNRTIESAPARADRASPGTPVAQLGSDPPQPPLPPRRPGRDGTGSQFASPVPPRPPQLVAARDRQIAQPAIPAPQARSDSGFQWPLTGAVVSRFGPKSDGRHNDGVNIAADAGTAIVAADNGVVAYAGNELRGYGNLVLIRHDGDWVTAYGHAGRLLVSRGDRVRAGQRIATVGSSGSVDSPQLHFEIRRGAVAVDPLKHLPESRRQVGLR